MNFKEYSRVFKGIFFNNIQRFSKEFFFNNIQRISKQIVKNIQGFFKLTFKNVQRFLNEFTRIFKDPEHCTASSRLAACMTRSNQDDHHTSESRLGYIL